ncbi:hypothetical protein EC991_003188 [Linnemannia zychae]|nr:hypothetical protein EC991_003188 [Linnemannia zychae]
MSGRHFLTAFRQLHSWRCPAAAAAAAEARTATPTAHIRYRGTTVYLPAYVRLGHRSQQHLHTRSYSTVAVSATDTSPPDLNYHNTGTNFTHPDPSTASYPKKERVLLLMSGGVDSSMCAHILINQGYDVTGLYMHNWNHDEETQDEIEPSASSVSTTSRQNTTHLSEPTLSPTPSSIPRTAPIRPKVCTSDRDWADVQSVCSQLGIPARRLDFSRQYWNQVFEVMLQEYERGKTPNPDVSCNREIKFGELIEWCHRNGGLGKDRFVTGTRAEAGAGAGGVEEGEGWDYLATGHYANVERDPVTGVAKLLRAKDSNKDQTYYLSTLSEKVLRHVLFPLAQYDKPTVKRMALATSTPATPTSTSPNDELTSLRNAALKKESMGICFVGKRKRFGDFLKEYLDPLPGPVRVNGLNGPLIGTHKGLFQYTVGQASGVVHKHNKWVVLRTDLPSNTLVVVDGTQNERLFSPGLIAEDWHWIAGSPPKKLLQKLSPSSSATISTATQDEYPFTAQIRHRQVPQPCTIEPIISEPTNAQLTTKDISSAQLFRVRFKDLQRAVAPGQQLVLYDKDECLGGAVIKSSLIRPEYAHEYNQDKN